MKKLKRLFRPGTHGPCTCGTEALTNYCPNCGADIKKVIRSTKFHYRPALSHWIIRPGINIFLHQLIDHFSLGSTNCFLGMDNAIPRYEMIDQYGWGEDLPSEFIENAKAKAFCLGWHWQDLCGCEYEPEENLHRFDPGGRKLWRFILSTTNISPDKTKEFIKEVQNQSFTLPNTL